jgi:hypothetical protein
MTIKFVLMAVFVFFIVFLIFKRLIKLTFFILFLFGAYIAYVYLTGGDVNKEVNEIKSKADKIYSK